MKKKHITLALICTAGGHFEQLSNLTDFYNRYDHFWITNESKQTVSTLVDETAYFVEAAHFKSPWKYLAQLPVFLRGFAKHRPTHVLSTGSGRTAFVPFLLAKILGVEFIFVDTFSRVQNDTTFAKFLLKTGHPVFSQWKADGNRGIEYIGPVLKNPSGYDKSPNPDYVFITLGTRGEGFTRLISAVEELMRKGVIKERVIVQAGFTRYESKRLEIFEFCSPNEIAELIINAKYVITQESAGIGTLCLKYRTRFIVMPRDYKYGELPAESDMAEDLQWKLAEMGYTKVVDNGLELEKAIRELDDLKTGFEFDNSLAIETLTRIIERTK